MAAGEAQAGTDEAMSNLLLCVPMRWTLKAPPELPWCIFLKLLCFPSNEREKKTAVTILN